MEGFGDPGEFRNFEDFNSEVVVSLAVVYVNADVLVVFVWCGGGDHLGGKFSGEEERVGG